jgi:GTPase SAR1 family protein
MNNNKEYVLLVVGQTGVGKSELGNAYLQQSSAFKVGDGPSSVTFLTSAEQNTVAGVIRYCIDTQGLNDTEGIDTQHVQQMVEFMRKWTKGVNAVALVINGQAPRLDAGTQRLIKIMHTFFNNTQFWDHVCLVFTKNYHDHQVNKDRFRTEYRNKVQDIIVECIGNETQRPHIPAFFVDSTEYNNDQDTKNELTALHTFVIGLPPLPTQHVVVPDIRFMRIEQEVHNNQLVNTQIVPYENGGRKKILTYEDQKREKRTEYDGVTITYSDWVGTK